MKLLPLLFLLTASTVTAQTDWQELQDYPGRFQILAPGEMTEAVDSITTDIGQVAHHTFYWQPADTTEQNLFYSVIWYDLPYGGINSDSTELTEEFFAATVESAAEAVRGEVRYKNYEELSGFPGWFWRIDYLDGKAVIKSKAWLVNNRYYELKTISWRHKTVNLDSEKFFSSFKLLVPGRADKSNK